MLKEAGASRRMDEAYKNKTGHRTTRTTLACRTRTGPMAPLFTPAVGKLAIPAREQDSTSIAKKLSRLLQAIINPLIGFEFTVI
jgi:hypothetical protein